MSKPGSSKWPFLGCSKCPFQGLSDLHLAYQKVTWKKLEYVYVFTHFHHLFVGSIFWLAIFSKCLAIVLSWSENTDFSGPYCWDMFWCHWWDVNFPSQRPSLITFQLKTASRCFWVPKTVFSFGKQLRINLSHLQFSVHTSSWQFPPISREECFSLGSHFHLQMSSHPWEASCIQSEQSHSKHLWVVSEPFSSNEKTRSRLFFRTWGPGT